MKPQSYLLLTLTAIVVLLSCRKPQAVDSTPIPERIYPTWNDTSGSSLFVYTTGWIQDRFSWATLINQNGKTIALIDSSTDGFKKEQVVQHNFYYDAQGKLIKVGESTFYYYDSNGRLEKYEAVGFRTDKLTYNSLNQIITDTQDYFNNHRAILNYEYDNAGNIGKVTREWFDDSGTLINHMICEYTYDDKLNIQKTTSLPPEYIWNHVKNSFYKGPNNIISSTTTINGISQTTHYNYTYNSNGLPISMATSSTPVLFRYK